MTTRAEGAPLHWAAMTESIDRVEQHTPEQLRRARVRVCESVTDRDDARLLLDMLGLLDEATENGADQ